MKKIIVMIICVTLICVGCTTNNNSLANEAELNETHIGGAVLKQPSRQVAENIYEDSGVIKTDEYKPFTKKMVVYGITFVAKDDISDSFLLKVAKTMKEMFPRTEGVDQELQEKVLQDLYRYNALIPVVKGEKDLESSKEVMKEFSKLARENSICDIIMEDGENKVLEVVEHILHTVTDVGLHYNLSDQWGLTKESMVYKSMQEAINKKIYNISNYSDIPKGDVKDRILIQEYAYWLITSAWNIQEVYGLGEEEWKLKNKEMLKESLPSGYELFEMNIPKIMMKPSKETLNSLDNKDNKVNKEKEINKNHQKYISTKDIIRDTAKLGGVYKKYYAKYIQYIAPNGKPITIVAQDKVADEQVLKAYNQLSFYLEDYGSYKKGEIANKITDNGAVLVMPNGADGESDIPEKALQGQPLYQMEVPTVGSKWYIENDYEHRDATYEEILHMVHDYGVGTKENEGALPDLQQQIYKAMKNSLPKDKTDWGEKGLWGLDSKEWLLELEKEGSLEQEYLASVVDSYYGLWGPFTEREGGMWGLYTSKTREDIMKNDPMGYQIVSEFLPSYITYMARIDSEFSGTFKMYFDENEPYTFKSKHLKNARLLGTKNSGVIGNSVDNILLGNSGDNIIEGKEGQDIVQFIGASTDYKITKKDNTFIVEDKLNRDGVDTLIGIEILRFTDKDIFTSDIKLLYN